MHGDPTQALDYTTPSGVVLTTMEPDLSNLILRANALLRSLALHTGDNAHIDNPPPSQRRH